MIKKIAATMIQWAVGVRRVEVLDVQHTLDILVITYPWWVGWKQAGALAGEITQATGLEVVLLPDGATLKKLKRAGRIEEPKPEGQAEGQAA